MRSTPHRSAHPEVSAPEASASEVSASSIADHRAGSGCPVEEIAQAYLDTTHGDAGIALRCAITDALADLLEAERRARENSRLISRGYVRERARRA